MGFWEWQVDCQGLQKVVVVWWHQGGWGCSRQMALMYRCACWGLWVVGGWMVLFNNNTHHIGLGRLRGGVVLRRKRHRWWASGGSLQVSKRYCGCGLVRKQYMFIIKLCHLTYMFLDARLYVMLQFPNIEAIAITYMKSYIWLQRFSMSIAPYYKRILHWLCNCAGSCMGASRSLHLQLRT